MLDPDPSFRPVRRDEGYLPLEDFGLIGDGRTAALVGLDGSIPWLCLPRFDSEPLFCALLDHARGGHFTVTPEGLTEARQRYQPDTGVLTTELRTPTGLVRLTDALVLRSGADLTDDAPADRAALVRSAVILDGEVRLRVDLEPRGGAHARALSSGLEVLAARRSDLQLHLRANRPLDSLHTTHDLRQGESLDLVFSWGRFHRHHRFDAEAMLLGSRLANRILEPIWNSTHIAEVEIVWDETLALEGRAGYYDGVGALKDMLQNHLLQLLCLVAMEPPISLDEHDLRNRKVDVLRSVRPLTESDVQRRTRRARYTAGRIGSREIPAYADEEGVDPARRTETFAEIQLEIDNWRWAGTVFRLRSGKALGTDRMEVAVHFREVPHLPFGHTGQAQPNLLSFGLDPESLTLHLTGTGSRAHALAPLALTARMEPPELPAYGRLLLDVLTGNPALSIRGDEAEEAWRIVAPVLAGWSAELVPLEEYPAGSDGPA